MILQFGQYKIDVDVEKTRKYYETAEKLSESCSCDGCRNFEQAVEILPPQVKDFFTGLGIDLRRICECTVFGKKGDKALSYMGFCHACGTVLEGKNACNDFDWDKKLAFPVSDNFLVSFRNNIWAIEDNFPLPAFKIDFAATIPWVLEKEFSRYGI